MSLHLHITSNFQLKRVNVQMMKLIKSALKPFYIISMSIGIDPRNIRHLRHYIKFISELIKYRRKGGEITRIYPILTDYEEQAGAARSQYFHQDLLVATFIFKANPERHIDIASRIDGFVAHVASFRKIEVMDVRPLENTSHENISSPLKNSISSNRRLI
jgi:hypothetical protein